MPFIQEDEETKRARELAEGGGIPVSGTQTGTIPGSTGTPVPGAKPQNAFVDVAAYLKANKAQSADTAQRVAEKLGQEKAGLQSGLQGSLEGYRKSVQAGTVTPNDELVNRAAANPVEFVKNPEDVKSFGQLRDASYTGPGNIEETSDFGTVLEKIKSGQERAKGIDTSEGRKAYLASVENNPTAGVISLDDLLIGGDPEARAKIVEASKGFDTLTGSVEEAKKQAAEALATGKTSTEEAKTAVANRFTGEGGAVPSFQAMLDEKVRQARETAVADRDKAAAILSGIRYNRPELSLTPPAGLSFRDQTFAVKNPDGTYRKPTLEELDLLDREFGNTNLYDTLARMEYLKQGTLEQGSLPRIQPKEFNLSDFLTNLNPDVELTRANVANPEDYAREAALEQLINENLPYLNQADIGLAGKVPGDLADFNTEQLREALTSAFEPYQGRLDRITPLTPYKQPLPPPVEPPPPPPPDPYAPPGPNDYPVKYINNEKMWWNNGQWVTAPEQIITDANGNVLMFDYLTGQYNPAPPDWNVRKPF